MQGFVITVDHWSPDTSITVTAEQLGTMLDTLHRFAGSVAGDHRGWTATVTIDEVDIDDARRKGVELIRAAAQHAGLTVDPVVRIEVVSETVRDSELEVPTLPDLVSGAEAAEILGVNRQRVHQLATQNPDFPKPLYQLGVGKLWARTAIDAFNRRWERKPGRPKKQPIDVVYPREGVEVEVSATSSRSKRVSPPAGGYVKRSSATGQFRPRRSGSDVRRNADDRS